MQQAPVTKEERDELRSKFSERLDELGKARARIIATGLAGGEIDCDYCKTGKLRFSVARSNGHVHAHCSTRLCLSWME
jgi:hypothetical protein